MDFHGFPEISTVNQMPQRQAFSCSPTGSVFNQVNGRSHRGLQVAQQNRGLRRDEAWATFEVEYPGDYRLRSLLPRAGMKSGTLRARVH